MIVWTSENLRRRCSDPYLQKTRVIWALWVSFMEKIAEKSRARLFHLVRYDFSCSLLSDRQIIPILARFNQFFNNWIEHYSFHPSRIFRPTGENIDKLTARCETNRHQAAFILPLARLPDSSSREAARRESDHEALHIRARHRLQSEL